MHKASKCSLQQKKEFTLTCKVDACSNREGLRQSGINPDDILNKVNRVGTIYYQLYDPQIEVKMPILEKFCSFHTSSFGLDYANLYKPGIEEPTIIDLPTLKAYGVEMTEKGLKIKMDDDTYDKYYFELGVRSGVQEEHDYWNIIHFRVGFKNPPCSLTLNDVSSERAVKNQH